jgi:hypothetical protein
MKGYWTSSGYMGFIDGHYELFVSDDEYIEIYNEGR